MEPIDDISDALKSIDESVWDLNNIEWINHSTIIAVINGYFRSSQFFDYNIRCDDFIKIVYKYLSERNVSFGKNCKLINAFTAGVSDISLLNNGIVVSVSESSQQLLS